LSPSKENVAPKEGSRASRFLKRVSTLGVKKKSDKHPSHSLASFAGSESNNMLHPEQRANIITVKPDTPPAVVVGDLNVQFPDSLVSPTFYAIVVRGDD
jgi:hypothetical protein